MAELVFIHGAADSGAVWELQTEHFGRSHQVLAVDLPGHGPRLGEPAIDTLDGIADEVVRQIDFGRDDALVPRLQAFRRAVRFANPKFRYSYDLGETPFPGYSWSLLRPR